MGDFNYARSANGAIARASPQLGPDANAINQHARMPELQSRVAARARWARQEVDPNATAAVSHDRTSPESNGNGDMSDTDVARTLNACAQRLSSSPPVVTLTVLESTNETSRLFGHFLCSMHRIGVVPLVWSLSLRTHMNVASRGVASIYVSSLTLQANKGQNITNLVSSQEQYKEPGSDEYINVVQLKPHAISKVLQQGYDVLYFDIDLGFKADPRPWLFQKQPRNGQADMQISFNSCMPNQQLLIQGSSTFATTNVARLLSTNGREWRTWENARLGVVATRNFSPPCCRRIAA